MSPQTAFAIRALGPDDIEAFRALLAVMGEAFDQPEIYTGAQPGTPYLEKFLGKDHVIALAAFASATVIGGLVAYELEKFEQERSEIYIYDLAVAEPYRRRGAATALIERLREIAATRGAWVIYVQADPPDAPAVALYSRVGIREDVLHFDIPVDGPKRR